MNENVPSPHKFVYKIDQNRVPPNQLYCLILLEDQSYSWYVSLKQMCDIVFRLAPVLQCSFRMVFRCKYLWGCREFPENYGADIWWFWCRYLEGSGSFRCRYLMNPYEVPGGRWRCGAKFRKIPAQIRRGIPEGFRADTWWCSGSFRRRW